MTETAKRVDSFAFVDESSICYWKDSDEQWWVWLPGCGAGMLRSHEVVEDEMGLITVTESIQMRGHKNGMPTMRHGYLRGGVWTDCPQ